MIPHITRRDSLFQPSTSGGRMIAPRRLLSAVILSALVGIVLGVPSAAAQQVPNMPDPPGVVAKSKTALTVTWTAPHRAGRGQLRRAVSQEHRDELGPTGPRTRPGRGRISPGWTQTRFTTCRCARATAVGPTTPRVRPRSSRPTSPSAGTAMADSHIRLAIDADTLLPARIFIRRMRWATGC